MIANLYTSRADIYHKYTRARVNGTKNVVRGGVERVLGARKSNDRE